MKEYVRWTITLKNSLHYLQIGQLQLPNCFMLWKNREKRKAIDTRDYKQEGLVFCVCLLRTALSPIASLLLVEPPGKCDVQISTLSFNFSFRCFNKKNISHWNSCRKHAWQAIEHPSSQKLYSIVHRMLLRLLRSQNSHL